MEDFIQVVDWSRAQFALTAMYHWIFVPLTLGLTFIIAFMETKYYRTGDEFYKNCTKFWMKLFGINFAVGVATGIILEFEFGTNWSNYSYFVGDIFGAPLAIEGIFAFFLESTFIAVMFFGWNKVGKGFHLTSTWLVAFGASLSALWILIANAWMQSPVGMEFNPETARNEMVDFWAIVSSPVAINKFFHTVTSGFVLAAVFVIGISSWFLLKGRMEKMARYSIKLAAIFGIVGSILVIWTGDGSAKQVARVQPMKLAAMEALEVGQIGAPLEVIPGIDIPYGLSVLSFGNMNAYVPGIEDLTMGNPERGYLSFEQKRERGLYAINTLAEFNTAKKNGQTAVADSIGKLFKSDDFKQTYFAYFGYGYLDKPEQIIPNIGLTYWSFRVMVGLGMWFLLMFVVWLVILKKAKTIKHWWLRLSLWSILLVYICSQAGWVVAEVGRQPWTIQDLLPTVAAVSRIESGAVQVTFWIFAALFTTLLIADITIMVKHIRKTDKFE